MRTFISNTDEKLKIAEFPEVEWVKNCELTLNNGLFKKIFYIPEIKENVEYNHGYYMSNENESTTLGFLSCIGKMPHPLVELSYACSWYNSNFGGIYLIGIDNVKNEYFAPIKKSN